jgi:hypothetical protein
MDGGRYIEAWPEMLSYILRNSDALMARGVVEVELYAGTRLCEELSGCLKEMALLPATVEAACDQVTLAAVVKLEHMRQAVRRMGHGGHGAYVSAVFGLGLPIDIKRPHQVAEAITAFLSGAQQNLERLHLFRLVSADLEDLKEHRRAILSLCGAHGPADEPPFARADRLLAALEGFYASLATAISQAFPESDPRRTEGLRRLPRARVRDTLMSEDVPRGLKG